MLVCEYTFLDDLSFIRPARQALRDRFPRPTEEKIDEEIETVSKLFKNAGWEGDGNIGIIWLPPFLNLTEDGSDTCGFYLWHVKQQNNGISYLGLEENLYLPQLTKGMLTIPGNWKSESILMGDVSLLQEKLETIWVDLLEDCSTVEQNQRIRTRLMELSQGLMVAALHDFINDCSLNLIMEATGPNPAYVHFSGLSVRISLGLNWKDSGGDSPIDAGGSSWLSKQALLASIWNSFCMLPYDQRLEMVNKSVDFKMDACVKEDLKKHVEIRNAFQHHEGRMTPSGLKKLGGASVRVNGIDTKLELKTVIPLSIEELTILKAAIKQYASSLERHVDGKVSTRHRRNSNAVVVSQTDSATS
jgi:hypothetical protein